MCSPVDRSWNSEFASNNFTHYRYDSNFITKIKNSKNCNVSLWSKIEYEQINRIFDYFVPADNAPNNIVVSDANIMEFKRAPCQLNKIIQFISETKFKLA
jgi:hypothetical protein